MSHLQLPAVDQLGDLRRKLQETQQVADGRAGPADRIGRFLMGDLEFPDQAVEGARLFHRVEVLALYVLDQRHRDGALIRHPSDHRRDVGKPGQLRGPPTTLARDDLVTLTGRPGSRWRDTGHLDGSYHDRLHHALRLDRLGERLEGLGPHVDAGLVTTPLQHIERQARQFLLGGERDIGCDTGRSGRWTGGARLTEQGFETASEAGLFRVHGRDDSGVWRAATATGAVAGTVGRFSEMPR